LNKKYKKIIIVLAQVGGILMDYTVHLPTFEGPLDLLLHLIKQSDINIHDISINDITIQYLDYINRMEELNIDVASE